MQTQNSNDGKTILIVIASIIGFLFLCAIFSSSNSTSTSNKAYKDNCDTVLDRNGFPHEICDDNGWYQHFEDEAMDTMNRYDDYIKEKEDEARADALRDQYYAETYGDY